MALSGAKSFLFSKSKIEMASPLGRILKLLMINVAITFVMEMFCREVLASWSQAPDRTKFFVLSESGAYAINRQSLINIAMTGFATLVGSWVLFAQTRLQRFIGFTTTGVLIAICAQATVSVLTGAAVLIGLHRFIFDMLYMCFCKFPMFEFGRRALVASQASITLLVSVRLVQDVSMSLFRIGLLNHFEIY